MHTDEIEIRKSRIDPSVWEVLQRGEVIEEKQILFPLRKVPPRFPDLLSVDRWLVSQEMKQAKQSAYRWLCLKSYSRETLKRKLLQQGYRLTVCDTLLEELSKLGYLQDQEYAQRVILQGLEKGYGPYYLEQKCRRLGLDPSLVRRYVTGSMQRKQIEKLKKKFSAAALARRGFDLEVLREVF